MDSKIEQLKKSQVKLIVELNKDDLGFYMREAEKRLANQIEVKGFRKGKVPTEVARKQLGEEPIRKEALDLALKQSSVDLIRENKLDVIEYSDLQIKENSEDKLVYEVVFSVFPKIELGSYGGVKVKKTSTDVHPEDLENTLKEIQKTRTNLEESNESAKKGDRVEVDFDIKLDGTTIEGGKSENHPVVIGSGAFLPGFEDNLISMKKDDEKTFKLKVPVDYGHKPIAGKELECNVKVKKVDHVIVPEINDEFAKDLGGFASLADLKKNIEQGIKMEKEMKAKDSTRLQMLEQITEKSKVEPPEVLVEKQLDSMMKGFDYELHQKGMELSLYLAHIKKTQDELRNDWRKNALKQVKMALVSREIAKQESIDVKPEEVEEEFNLAIQQFVGQGGSVKNEDELNKLKDRIHDTLLNEKVFQFLEKKAEFV
ncbi:MAG: trigger factor [Candidatus Yanofskybacteria bacterium CG10_big_fil_rev_8_21_14_0_10_36_16]|uniref:Trigger factor n=1 Tax=Candidatus Yanofskybacteria bacterium CG10_big_fil_rev_8_21_14_0_10_36_16 TaxID=1975096 RepID=A0A2J0Q6F6_9BACT|nr:MAG: trigger factor [Candidatus Yanofskybacteria bacterium CG10_big_fil_rev_8_21_14_0_10_36_16]